MGPGSGAAGCSGSSSGSQPSSSAGSAGSATQPRAGAPRESQGLSAGTTGSGKLHSPTCHPHDHGLLVGTLVASRGANDVVERPSTSNQTPGPETLTVEWPSGLQQPGSTV